MSDYVEARYALLTLEQARESTDEQATSLLNGLLQDLSRTQKRDLYRADTLASIRHLAVVLCAHKAPPTPCWDAACEAAYAWRDHAYR